MSPELPPVPGGWTTQTFDLGFRTLELVRPAVPDQLLDDPDVLEANRLDDYMPYWSYLWPASLPMARALAAANWPPGCEVLEIGSGVGLVGLAALARGWKVTFSDYDETSLAVCRLNAQRNGLAGCDTLRLDWRQPVDRTFPVILGCEVIYEARSHADVLALIRQMLAPGGCAWLGDPGRSQAPLFYQRARDAGFDVTMRDDTGRECAWPVSSPLQIFELRRAETSDE